jgi:N-methylhydantoinase A/oxoprolinase/acetone carboxylase beta subunit
MSSSSSLYLGIDTGGTFTDGVLLDPSTRTVVKSVKVLTTHHDLRICIAEVIKKLAAAADLQTITLVSLSTTLATNAIAEGKRKRVGLFLLGYDAGLVEKFGFQRQFGTDQFYFIQGRHGLDGIEQVALDKSDVAKIVKDIHGTVEAFAVSSYAGPRNASHEERTSEIISGLTHLPVVQAHHLSSELDSIRRATTVSLNASLLSNIHEFLEAVKVMLTSSAISCPVMIVRSDGSIVNSEVARKKPVEIIHSGPATSAIGGQFLPSVIIEPVSGRSGFALSAWVATA